MDSGKLDSSLPEADDGASSDVYRHRAIAGAVKDRQVSRDMPVILTVKETVQRRTNDDSRSANWDQMIWI